MKRHRAQEYLFRQQEVGLSDLEKDSNQYQERNLALDFQSIFLHIHSFFHEALEGIFS